MDQGISLKMGTQLVLKMGTYFPSPGNKFSSHKF